MEKSLNERILESSSKYLELMNLVYSMKHDEDENFQNVVELIQDIHKDQLKLICMINDLEKQEPNRVLLKPLC